MMQDLQRADFWKRISAYIFDKIIVFILAAGFAFLLTAILGTESHSAKIRERTEYYNDLYTTNIGISAEEYEALSDDEKAKFDEATKAFNEDETVLDAVYMVFNLTLITATLSILLAYAVAEFAVPLFLKNGQTVGKKIFGLAVMRIDGVKATAPIMFIRAILGKCTIETLVPVMAIMAAMFIPSVFGLTGPIIAVAVPIVSLVTLVATKNRAPIHDLFASTVTVDMSTQLIFDSEEEMLAYKKKLHAEMSEKAEY